MNDYTSIADLYGSHVTDTSDHAFWSRRAAEATGPILETYRVLGVGDQVLKERRLTLRFVLVDAVSLVGMAAEAGLEAQAALGDYHESPHAPGNSPFILAVPGRA